MNATIVTQDLSKQAPHSPRERIGGFAIAARTVDKCRASAAGILGEYHFDCPLDKVLFSFKGISASEFITAVTASKNYEDVGTWLQTHGTKKTPEEIKAWSDARETESPMTNPARRTSFMENCRKLGLNPETATAFDWLEADDLASFSAISH